MVHESLHGAQEGIVGIGAYVGAAPSPTVKDIPENISLSVVRVMVRVKVRVGGRAQPYHMGQGHGAGPSHTIWGIP